jgi:ABC-2 type transport system permease protein
VKRLRKWAATIAVEWQKHAAYRTNFVLLVIGPAVVFFFVKVSLWTSIYAGAGGGPIGGMPEEEMLAYQCYVLVVALLAQGYNSVALANDIRLGRITAHLLHPFGFLEYHVAAWVAFEILQLLVAAVTLGLAAASGLVTVPATPDLLAGLGFSMLVAALWFWVMVAIGLAAFWLEQTWVLRVILLQVSAFLSGALLPLELYPGWLRDVLVWTPFPYLTWVPARIFAGAYPELGQAVAVTCFWVLAAWGLTVWIWRRGLRLYSAAGM